MYRDGLSIINYTLNKCTAALRIKPTRRGKEQEGKKRASIPSLSLSNRSLSCGLLALLTGDPLPLSASVSEASKRLVGAETAARKNLVPRADPAIFHRAERFPRRACEKSHAWAPWMHCPRRSGPRLQRLVPSKIPARSELLTRSMRSMRFLQ